MKNTLLATLAVTFAPLALAAEGSDNDTSTQPTMAELAAKVDSLSTEIDALAATVGNLATAVVGTHATSTEGKVDSLAAKVDNLAASRGQVAAIMAVARDCRSRPNVRVECWAKMYLIGSSIRDWPASPLPDTGFNVLPDLPEGVYLIELQQPYSNEVGCLGVLAHSVNLSTPGRPISCPQLLLTGGVTRGHRLDDGFGVYTATATIRSFVPKFRFKKGTELSSDRRPSTSYAGSIKITKLR